MLCKSTFDDPAIPLGTGYRVTYWVLGLFCSLALLADLQNIIHAASFGVSTFIHAAIEQWVFILFIGGAVFALKKDAAIRKRNRLGEK